MLSFTPILILILCEVVHGAEYHIQNVDQFIALLSKGTTYSGHTVFLDSDIDFTGKTMNPIGNFLGTFDGQGYTISNLKMSASSSGCVGLFGYTGGMTVKKIL